MYYYSGRGRAHRYLPRSGSATACEVNISVISSSVLPVTSLFSYFNEMFFFIFWLTEKRNAIATQRILFHLLYIYRTMLQIKF